MCLCICLITHGTLTLFQNLKQFEWVTVHLLTPGPLGNGGRRRYKNSEKLHNICFTGEAVCAVEEGTNGNNTTQADPFHVITCKVPSPARKPR